MSNGGLRFCFDKNGHKQLRQKKKHNKSYSELNGSSDRGPGCHTEGPWGQTEQHTAPRAAGSHFLPGAGGPKQPIVTPEELRLRQDISLYQKQGDEIVLREVASGCFSFFF